MSMWISPKLEDAPGESSSLLPAGCQREEADTFIDVRFMWRPSGSEYNHQAGAAWVLHASETFVVLYLNGPFKGPIFSPFSDLNFPSWTPAEQLCMKNYPK